MYCSHCGHILESRQITIGEPDRMVCTACEKVHYENPLPTAGAFIVQNQKLLLVRRAAEPFKGEWDIPGGFLEKHEHPEEALKRELREELGVDAAIQGQVGIFMGTYDGTDVSTLNIYYRASISGTPVPASDIDGAEWFPLDSLPSVAFPQNQEAIAEFLHQTC